MISGIKPGRMGQTCIGQRPGRIDFATDANGRQPGMSSDDAVDNIGTHKKGPTGLDCISHYQRPVGLAIV